MRRKYCGKQQKDIPNMVVSRFSVRGHEDMRTRGQPPLPTTSIELMVILNIPCSGTEDNRSEQNISSNQYACDCFVVVDSSPGRMVRGQPAHSKAVSRVGHPTKIDTHTQHLQDDAFKYNIVLIDAKIQ